MRYAFVASQRTRYPLNLLCTVLEVSVSGFHDYRRRKQKRADLDADATIRKELRSIHAASRRTYGRRRLVQELRARGHRVGPKRVVRPMAEEELRAETKGGFKPKSASPTNLLHGNLLDRRFTAGSDQPALRAFANAWAAHPQKPYLILHSDRGGEYISARYDRLLQRLDVAQSVGRLGSFWDCAVVELVKLSTEAHLGLYSSHGNPEEVSSR